MEALETGGRKSQPKITCKRGVRMRCERLHEIIAVFAPNATGDVDKVPDLWFGRYCATSSLTSRSVLVDHCW